ncbi:MAG: C39 family peptidase [Eubacterium sp.]|nr:C39 family peptidase [Eubacterium sp.]
MMKEAKAVRKHNLSMPVRIFLVVLAMVTGLLLAAPAQQTQAAVIPGDRILGVPYINQHLGLWVPAQHGYTNAWWANQHFEGSTRTLSTSGCGFACAAMAISYMRGGEVLNPVEIMNRACGFNGVAGDRDCGVKAAAKYGFRAETVTSPGKARIISEILAGHPVMVLEQKSKFGGGGGHFVLLMGYRNGKFAVYDPSNERMAWVCDQITHTWKEINDGAWRINSTAVAGEYTIFYAGNRQVKIGNDYYLQDAGGKNLTGFQYIPEQNKTCYYDPLSGKMLYGKQKIGNYWYYFDTSTGAMKTNAFVTVSGKTCYYNAKGHAVTGLKKINGKRYYFKPSNYAMVKSKFVKIPGMNRTCYFNKKGQAVTGYKKIKGHYYYFSSKVGAMRTNQFVYIASKHKTCYFNKKGRMVYGRKKINGTWYTFSKRTGALLYKG